MVCLGNICINTLHKGDNDDDNNNNNNNKLLANPTQIQPSVRELQLGHIIPAEIRVFTCTCYARNKVGRFYFILRNSRGITEGVGAAGLQAALQIEI
jgi:hypothetical protein